MKIYEIGTGYTPIPAQIAAATESVVEELTKAFVHLGEPVEILDISTENRAPHNLPISEVKVPSIFTRSDVSLGIMHKLKRVVYSVALSFKLKQILKKESERVVLHFHNQYNLFFFSKLVSEKLRKKAFIAYTNHNGFWSLPLSDAEPTLKKRYFQEIEAMKCSDVVFALNQNMKNNIQEYLNLNPDSVVKINNGVNTEIYRPLSEDEISEIKKSLGLAGKRVILQVGSVNENKGQHRAVKMLAPLLKKDASVVYAYVGEIVSAEYQEVVQKTVKELNLENQVVYLNAVSPGEELNRLYNIASATIFLSNYEAFGLVCVESLSAGTPVLVCANTLLDFGAGCLRCSSQDAVEHFDEILSSGESLRVTARKTAEDQYTWTKIAGDYQKSFPSCK